MKYLRLIAVLLLAGIFGLSGYAKLMEMNAFELFLYRSTGLGFDLSSILGRLVVGAEWLIAIGLLSRIKFRTTWWFSLLFTLVLSLFLLFQILAGEGENCHCFGELLEMSPGESLAKNALLILLLVFIRPLGSVQLKYGKVLFGLLIILALVTPVISSPPDILVKGRYDQATHNQEALELALDSNFIPHGYVEGKKLIAFYSVGCSFCKLSSERMSAFFQRKDLDQSSMKLVIWGEETDPSEFFEETKSLDFDYINLPTDQFLEITKGRMPLILLVEDGKVQDAMYYRTLDEGKIHRFLTEGKY